MCTFWYPLELLKTEYITYIVSLQLQYDPLALQSHHLVQSFYINSSRLTKHGYANAHVHWRQSAGKDTQHLCELCSVVARISYVLHTINIHTMSPNNFILLLLYYIKPTGCQ